MRFQIKQPNTQELEDFLAGLADVPYSYPEVGASAGQFPEGYLHSYDRFYLGEGQGVWEQACELIRNWKMFPAEWTFTYPTQPPIADQVVAVCFRQFGLWWRSACRIVYCVEENNQYGFAYGTLPVHAGSGEEYFGVERDQEGRSWFVIKAFSIPQYWGTRLLPTYMRAQQRRFIGEAGQQMQRLIKSLQMVRV
ncbi:MAG: DUF1990 domain-containing protein [Bacteroidota bacterium]